LVNPIILINIILKILQVSVSILNPLHQLTHNIPLLLHQHFILINLLLPLQVLTLVFLLLTTLNQSLFKIETLHQKSLQVKNLLLESFLLFNLSSKNSVSFLQVLNQCNFVLFYFHVSHFQLLNLFDIQRSSLFYNELSF
jgi:hypothetical protein